MKDTHTHPAGKANAVTVGAPSGAETVLKALTKLVNGRKIYAENNPRLEQFRDEFTGALRRFFDQQDELVLSVEPHALKWEDAVVYENERRDESLAFILFKDGIGEITLLPGVVSAEAGRLVDILAGELHNREAEEDVVTRLWNADFEHVTYRVRDDYLSGEFGKGSSDASDDARHDETSDHPELLPSLAERGRVIVQRSDALQSIDTFLHRVLASHHPEGDDAQREALYQRMLRTTFVIPAEELAIYTRELEAEKAEDGVAAFAESMFEFTLLPDNPSGVRDVLSIIDRMVDFTIDEKNPATLAHLTAAVTAFLERDDLPEVSRAGFEKAMGRLSHPAILADLFERIDRPGPYTEATLRYARAIGAAAVEPLTRAIHRIEGNAVHRDICDALIGVGGESLATALEGFDIDRPAVAVDAVYIARALELPLSPRLRELVFYPDARVKLDMIDWISSRKDDEATRLLIKSLDDLDKRVRLRVLESLESRAVAHVRDRVSELAFGKDFNERAADEQEAFFRTLGSVGDIHTVDQIRSMLERRKRLGSGKGVDGKLLAIRALERIHHPAALELLNRLVGDTSEAVRLRAARASETLSNTLAAAAAEKKA
jgi:hypothetical protein